MKMASAQQIYPIAICTADWHLSHNPPIFRSAEPNWYAAMQRVLEEIVKLSVTFDGPILCAGDMFHKWNSPPELINFAMRRPNRGKTLAIAGQHDLPNHNFNEIERSAYWTLCYGNAIHHIDAKIPSNWGEMKIYGFSYGSPLKPLPKEKVSNKLINVALVHDYVWTAAAGCSYPHAPKNKEIKNQSHSKHLINGKYYGYDVIVYGDNHRGFKRQIGETVIFNCGTLMRRNSDEINYCPQVGLLMSDGSVEIHLLDISQDKCLPVEEAKVAEREDELNMEKLAAELHQLGSSALDFAAALESYCEANSIKESVKKILLEAMNTDERPD